MFHICSCLSIFAYTTLTMEPTMSEVSKRQLGVRFFSMWCYTWPGVGILAMKNSFLGHK